jgi:hypothetical protein
MIKQLAPPTLTFAAFAPLLPSQTDFQRNQNIVRAKLDNRLGHGGIFSYSVKVIEPAKTTGCERPGREWESKSKKVNYLFEPLNKRCYYNAIWY